MKTAALLAALVASHGLTWFLTASHYEAIALSGGWAYRVRYPSGVSEIRYVESETKGVWR